MKSLKVQYTFYLGIFSSMGTHLEWRSHAGIIVFTDT